MVAFPVPAAPVGAAVVGGAVDDTTTEDVDETVTEAVEEGQVAVVGRSFTPRGLHSLLAKSMTSRIVKPI